MKLLFVSRTTLERGPMKPYAVVFACLLLPACTTEDNPLAPDGALPDAGAADAGGDGSGYVPPGVERTLIEASYQIPSGNEKYFCMRETLTEEVIVTRFAPVAPPGVHHTVLAVDNMTKHPDGAGGPCPPLDEDWVVLFASGIDSPALDMPAGVGMRLPVGTQLVYQLHLFNATDDMLEETSIIMVNDADDADIQHEAEVVLAGPFDLRIPPGQITVQEGGCTLREPVNYFACFPTCTSSVATSRSQSTREPRRRRSMTLPTTSRSKASPSSLP